MRQYDRPPELSRYSMLREDAIHGADRAVVDVLIEQSGIDFRRRLVDETGRVQQVQNRLLLWDSERPGGPRPRAGDQRRHGETGASALHGGA